VAPKCNPSNSEGSDQEDRSSKPARANSLRDPISKKTFTERVLWVLGPPVQAPFLNINVEVAIIVEK
jgi:hypothetical protein